MAGTFLCPRACGFVKVATIEIARKARSEARKRGDETASQFRARIHEEQFRLFEEIFKDLGEQTLNYKGFVKKLPALLEKLNKWSSKKLDQKAKYMNVFSLLHWKQLPTAQKREHTMSNCKSCNVRHSETLALFPVNSNNIRGKALKNPVFAASQVNDSLRGAAGKVSPTQREIKSAARSIYNTIAPSFHQTYNVPLAEALSQVSELNLQNKTKSDLQEVRRQHYRATKESVEKQMEETAFAR